jgi:glycosyltransferase involved in cell wall biosynthesis
MKILLANNHLDKFGGSERWVYTMAQELVKRNDVYIFTRKKGKMYEKLMELGCREHSLDEYGLLLINHTTCCESLADVKGFKIQTCHGTFPPVEAPSDLVDIHVAVSEEVARHHKITNVIHNPVNLEEYTMRTNPEECEGVLSLCQGDGANRKLKQVFPNLVCHSKNVGEVWDLAKEINKYKFVVGVGRGVIEAMACGRPVLIYDDRSYMGEKGDGWTTDKLTRNSSRRYNYSGRRYEKKLSELEKNLPEFDPYEQIFYVETFHNVVSTVRQYLHLMIENQ